MRRNKHKKACHYQQSVCIAQRRISFPVEIVKLEDDSYHLIVKVEINGISGDMIIDTGASVTVVDNQLFPGKPGEQMEAKMQSGSVTGKIEDIRLIKTRSFRIQGQPIANQQLAAIDLNYVNDMYHLHLKRKIIGLLGCDFCVKHKAVINYQSKEFSILRPRFPQISK